MQTRFVRGLVKISKIDWRKNKLEASFLISIVFIIANYLWGSDKNRTIAKKFATVCTVSFKN